MAIIKYYELRNDRVLVLCPKRLRENWTIYLQNDERNIFCDDRFRYDVLNHSDLSRSFGMSGDINLETVKWGNYDLVVIDESHNFRNNAPNKNHGLSRYKKLMQDIVKAGVRTKILMLSATPVNNKMNDLVLCFIIFKVKSILRPYYINLFFILVFLYRFYFEARILLSLLSMSMIDAV